VSDGFSSNRKISDSTRKLHQVESRHSTHVKQYKTKLMRTTKVDQLASQLRRMSYMDKLLYMLGIKAWTTGLISQGIRKNDEGVC
jgi:hypothetical protein